MPGGDGPELARGRTQLAPEELQGRVTFDHLSYFRYSGPLAGTALALVAVLVSGGHGHVGFAGLAAVFAAVKHFADAPSLLWDDESVRAAVARTGPRETRARESARIPWHLIVGASAARWMGRNGTRELLVLHLSNGDRVAPLVLADRHGRRDQMRAFARALAARDIPIESTVEDFLEGRTLPVVDQRTTGDGAGDRASARPAESAALPWTFRMDDAPDAPDGPTETWHHVTARDERGRMARLFSPTVDFPPLMYSTLRVVGIMAFSHGTWTDTVIGNRHIVLEHVQRVTVERGALSGTGTHLADDAGAVLHLANGTKAVPLALVDDRRDVTQVRAFLDTLVGLRIPVDPDVFELVDPRRGTSWGSVTSERDRRRG